MGARVFLGLGANLGDPPAQLREAIRRLGEQPQLRVVRAASIYRSKPVGPQDQPDFANTIVELETTLVPAELLAALKNIEHDMGRRKSARWGPREIDLDILIYGDLVLREPALVIPHAELANRRFVLAPLAELAPDLIVPGSGQSVRALLQALAGDPAGVWREA